MQRSVWIILDLCCTIIQSVFLWFQCYVHYRNEKVRWRIRFVIYFCHCCCVRNIAFLFDGDVTRLQCVSGGVASLDSSYWYYITVVCESLSLANLSVSFPERQNPGVGDLRLYNYGTYRCVEDLLTSKTWCARGVLAVTTAILIDAVCFVERKIIINVRENPRRVSVVHVNGQASLGTRKSADTLVHCRENEINIEQTWPIPDILTGISNVTRHLDK